MPGRFADLGAAAGLGLLAMAAPADAHHSQGTIVDMGTQMSNEMVLPRIAWINPHSWFHFNMQTPDGTLIKDVKIEWMSVSGLRQMGYTSPDFMKVGRAYTMTYYPNRNGTPGGSYISARDMVSGLLFDWHGPDGAPPEPASH